MQVVVIPVREEKETLYFIEKAEASGAHAIELRLDYLPLLSLDLIRTLRLSTSLPIIFTLRKKAAGGYYTQNEKKRLAAIFNLCTLKPDFMDIEMDVDRRFISKINKTFPTIKLIGSYHNFYACPARLDQLLQKMQHPGFYTYKIAVFPQSIIDTLRLLIFVKNNKNKRISGIGMGEHGACTRILGPIVGNFMNYSAIHTRFCVVPYQYTLPFLKKVYRVHQLQPTSRIYALLGDAEENNIDHLYHNVMMQVLGEDAVGIQIKVKRNELSIFLKLAKALPFTGFSITKSLTEWVFPHLDRVEESLKNSSVVNGVILKKRKWIEF